MHPFEGQIQNGRGGGGKETPKEKAKAKK